MNEEEIGVDAVVEEEEIATDTEIDALKGDKGEKGDDGDKGDKGDDGYTPIKGIDYFTNTEQQQFENEIKSSVLNEIEPTIEQHTQDISNIQQEQTTQNTAIANLQQNKAETSDIPDVSGFITKDVDNLTNYTLKTNTGSLIDLEINGTTYVITLSLKNQDGTVISTDTIDLPLESVVVGGRYDSTNQKIILTLENGNTVDIPVGDLVAGLQTELSSTNKLNADYVDDSNSGNKFVNTSEKQTWNAKYDKPSGGIPKTDLDSNVQSSLNKADSALQEHQSLADYVKNTDYATGNKGGTIKTDIDYGFGVNSIGKLYAPDKTYEQYLRAGIAVNIGKGTLENVIAGKQLINKPTLDESQAEQDTAIQSNTDNIKQLESLIPKGTKSGESITINDSADYKVNRLGIRW